MLQIAQTIAQLALLEQFQKSERHESDFKAWVASQNYFIDDNLVDKNFTVRIFDDSFFKSIGYDCDKFTRATIETIAAIQHNKIFKKNSSWPVINAYYASFFAAHALLRAFGISFTQLSQQHTQKILDHAKNFGKDAGLTSLTTGFYKTIYDVNTKVITFEWMKDAHADLWASFYFLVQKLIQDIPNVAAILQDKLDAMDLLTEIKAVITQRSARGNWLSTIRNEVNYQSALGSWYPYSDSMFDDAKLITIPKKLLAQNISGTLIDANSNLNTALNTSLRITNLLIFLVKECNKKFKNENFNFKNGSLKMMNMVES